MAKGVYNIPRKFKGENRFLSFGRFGGLTTKGLIYTLIGVGITILLTNIAGGFGYGYIGAIVGILITVFLVIIAMIKVPSTMYLYNAGQTLDILLLLIIKRKINKCIYTRAHHQYREREEKLHEITRQS